MKHKRVKQESLKVGDILHLGWCGNKHKIQEKCKPLIIEMIKNEV